ncbi:hypothetical protein Acsp03_02530 [Actinomadura sp. NBRC 104412]|nr:hypothetical protein Acsp03_02530 [Actinomadura sp. NBRC 104412]
MSERVGTGDAEAVIAEYDAERPARRLGGPVAYVAGAVAFGVAAAVAVHLLPARPFSSPPPPLPGKDNDAHHPPLPRRPGDAGADDDAGADGLRRRT